MRSLLFALLLSVTAAAAEDAAPAGQNAAPPAAALNMYSMRGNPLPSG